MTEETTEDIELIDDEEGRQLYEHFRFTADRGQVPVRIDKFMFK